MKKYQQKTFRFNNETIDDNYVDITISIIERNPNDDYYTYYDITYENKYSNEKVLNHHPLYKLEDVRLQDGKYHISGSDGEFIVKNSLSEQLIKYLLMDLDELEMYSGNTSAIEYKANIMKSINLFWD